MRQLIVGLALLTFVTAPAIALADTYSVTDLGAFCPLGINDSGQIVGTAFGAVGAVLYENGVIIGFGAGFNSYAYSINDSGDIVGRNGRDSGYHAFLYTGSQVLDLTVGQGWSTYSRSWARGINNLGQIVGYHDYSSTGFPVFPPPDSPATGFVYSGGTMTMLSPPSGYNAILPLAINDSGKIAGLFADSGSREAHAFVYSGGIITSIADDATAESPFDKIDINSFGDVVGSYKFGGGFLYKNGQTTSLGMQCSAINDAGQIVGGGSLYQNGAIIDLTAAIQENPAWAGWTLDYAVDINNHGQITGYGHNPAREWHAILLAPVPEPSTLVLLAGGAACLLAYGWRRRTRTAR